MALVAVGGFIVYEGRRKTPRRLSVLLESDTLATGRGSCSLSDE